VRAKIIVILIALFILISVCHAQTLKPEYKLIKLDFYFPDDNQVEQGIFLKI